MSIAHTRIFYTILMEDDFSAFQGQENDESDAQDSDCSDPLSSLLSPDCRVQNKFGDLARGESGLHACVRRLRRLQAALLPLPASTRQGILVPVSASQTLIYFSLLVDCSKGSTTTQQRVTLGIGLEWERGVVTGLVIRHEMRHLDPDTFITLVMYSNRKECHVQIQGVIVSANEIQEGQLTSCELAEGDDVVSVDCQPPPPSSTGLESSASEHPREVWFSDMLKVVLVPVVSSYDQRCASTKGDSDCFYSRQDFHRFSRQRDFEVADMMRDEGLSHDEALQALYLSEDSVGQLRTELNYHIPFEVYRDEEQSLKNNGSGALQHVESDDETCEDSIQSTHHDHDNQSLGRRNSIAGVEGGRFKCEWLSDSDDDTIDGDKRHDAHDDARSSTGGRDEIKVDEVDGIGEGESLQRGRLRGCSFSASGISEWGCRGRSRSASASVCGGKHGVVGVSGSGRAELPDESLLDAQRYVHFQQRYNEYLGADSTRALNVEDLTGQGLTNSAAELVRPCRSASADGRLQSSANNLVIDEDMDAWYPGKYLQRIRDGAVGVGGHEAEYNMSSSRAVDRSSSSCSSSSKGSLSSLDSTSEAEDESDGWYFGKLMKRVMTKVEPHDERGYGGDGWFLGKYIQKAMTPLPVSRQIFNAHDSLRLTGTALSNLHEAVNVQKAVETNSSSSDSDSDSDDGFTGIHRKRSRKVLLPRVAAAGWILGRTIAREGLSRSPVNVEVTVLGCHGLKSNSVFPPYSPVTFVEVSVGDNTPIRTIEASRSSSPTYQEKLMQFPLSALDVVGEYLHFTVYERFVSTGQKVVLGQAQLSLSAIPVCDGSDQTTTVTLQLVSKVSADFVGKGLYQPLRASTGAGARRDWQRATFHESSAQKSYDEIKREAHKASTSSRGSHSAARRLTADDHGALVPPPIINISICKIDEAMFSVLKQLRDEDAVCERQCAATGELGGTSSYWLDEEPCFSQDP
mmetsp:Transcript_30259/g.56294  ORF Transcript_30259/g.56294 Transcript_30259/m.56294 type:complete len:970 (-) Transcript_30259:1004-3913(-)